MYNNSFWPFRFQVKWTCGRKSRRDAGAITIWRATIVRVAWLEAAASAGLWRRTVVRNAVWSSTARTVRFADV